jgi:hypothetical protein
MNKIKRIWKSRKNILKGIWNKLFPTPTITEIAEYRQEICKGCSYYDKNGTSEKAIIPGQPCCSLCGCAIAFLTHDMESSCTREEIGEIPLWIDEKRYKDEN